MLWHDNKLDEIFNEQGFYETRKSGLNTCDASAFTSFFLSFFFVCSPVNIHITLMASNEGTMLMNLFVILANTEQNTLTTWNIFTTVYQNHE